MIVATCTTAGAAIGWTADAPKPPQASAGAPLAGLGRAVGNPEMDGRCWQLYTGPIAAPADGVLWFQAHRLGYLASEDVALISE